MKNKIERIAVVDEDFPLVRAVDDLIHKGGGRHTSFLLIMYKDGECDYGEVRSIGNISAEEGIEICKRIGACSIPVDTIGDVAGHA